MKQGILFLLLSLALLSGTICRSQNTTGFDEMIERMVKGTVPYISAEALNEEMQTTELYLLDTREREEFDTSHLPDAHWVGYKDLDEDYLKSIPLGATIVTYCSIGYRSEKVGMRLQSMGHQKVYNLYGGIFDWANKGYALASDTKTVHGYNKKWSKWLDPDSVDIVIQGPVVPID